MNSARIVRLKLKVVPGASNSSIVGWLGDALKVRVVAAPEKGKANKEVLRLLSKALSVQRGELSLVSGLSAPLKILEVSGLSIDEIKSRLDVIMRINS
ncbi:MAG: hypothetical protein COA71_03365 [SAR86 cluster bacterium]|uniref:UPF0235 protein COA71_03365 n=1 Tax=SAR86 cluster bacterium TaxID=2030880 RepID=A0A2A5CF93_9GAMM|nr:DUF167 domain-containing protein [bacterium AH-315-I11]MBN4075847.1 DUF167 domain-containing protein [Gammaproteobacteria bacterium AH-315-E17]PCJ42564.1 MAG: hypothetical protein COA71_03365 [SAR86 cluster bacterium]